jgi:hypothetical protein
VLCCAVVALAAAFESVYATDLTHLAEEEEKLLARLTEPDFRKQVRALLGCTSDGGGNCVSGNSGRCARPRHGGGRVASADRVDVRPDGVAIEATATSRTALR